MVELLGAKFEHFFLRWVAQEANGEGRGREVSREGRFVLLPSGKFKKTAEGKNLEGTSNRNREASIPSGRNIREFGSVKGDVTREADSGVGHQVSDNTKLADTSVLDLNTTKAVELCLVTISYKAKGIEEAKRGLGSEFILYGEAEKNRER